MNTHELAPWCLFSPPVTIGLLHLEKRKGISAMWVLIREKDARWRGKCDSQAFAEASTLVSFPFPPPSLFFQLVYLHGLVTTQFSFAIRMQLFTALATFFRLDDSPDAACVVARIQAKEHYPIDQLQLVLAKFLAHDFEYACDGVTLMPNLLPVRFGTNWLFFKVRGQTRCAPAGACSFLPFHPAR
jgi:hypothetical protein